MDHVVVSPQGFVQRRQFADVTLLQPQIGFVADRAEDGLAIHEEIKHRDLVARGQQLRNQHAADIAGAAGDHHVPFSVIHNRSPESSPRYFSNAVTNLTNGTFSTDLRWPTMPTLMAPAALPMKATSSM